jgi:hypothetical protein
MIQELKDRTMKLLNNCPKDNEVKLIRLKLIQKILNDESCFFKMRADDAYNILLDLEYKKEESIEIYKKLISYQNYCNLTSESIVDSE